MTRTRIGAALLALLTAVGTATATDPRQALQPFNDLIGTWRVTGTPEGKPRTFWTEEMTWAWQFKGSDAWLSLAADKGKYFTRGELRTLGDKEVYQLTLTTPAKESRTFTGKLDDRRLTLTREDDKTKETQQIVVTLLHANRFLFDYAVKPQGKTLFAKQYRVGATKEGVSFAEGDGKPECIISGGLGTIRVTYKGQTYYVCCSGCRDEFNAEPEKYIKEYEEAKKKKKK